MRRTLLAAAAMALTLAGCATVRDSSLNPFNWFGRSTERVVATPAGGGENALIPRRRFSLFGSAGSAPPRPGPPIDRVADLVVERLPGGAVIRATGVAARLGAFDARLVPERLEGDATAGALGYTFRVRYPPDARARGRAAARTVTVATYLTDQQLSGIRAISVAGTRNVRTVRR